MHRVLRYPKLIICLGFSFVLLLAGINKVFANPPAADAQPGAEASELTITLQAPAFEPVGATGVRLLEETDRYTFEQPEGSPILPHRLYKLALPPDADPLSLQMQIVDVLRESLPGVFNVPLAGPRVLACAPVETSASDSCSVPASSSTTASAIPGIFRISRASLQLSFSPEARLLPYGQLRKWRFARLDFAPFQYDAQQGSLSVARSLTVRVSFRRDPSLLDTQLLADSVMDDYAPTFFDNYAEAQPQYAAAAQAIQPNSAVPLVLNDYLIITTNAIYNNSNLGQFMVYLEQHGHSVSTVTTSTIVNYSGATLSDKIRTYLKTVYVSWGLRYVLLVGNPDPASGDVPMKMTYPDRLTNLNPTTDHPRQEVPTDLYYANLTGNWDLNSNGFAGETGNNPILEGDLGPGGVDLTPSVYVGRIPVYNNDYAALNSILQKIEDYEDIAHRQAWQNRALLPMSFWGEGYDAATLGYLLETNLLAPRGFSSYSIYMNHPAAAPCNQVSGYPRDAVMADQAVVNRWASVPVGLMVWAAHGNVARTSIGWGHGDTDCWLAGDFFNSGQAASLNDAQPAFTFHNSCLNGKPESADNQGYALLRQGAVATVSASRVTYLDGNGDTEGNMPTNYNSGAGIGYNYVNYLLGGASASEALMWARANLTFGPYTNLQNQYDFNLYGEPAMVFYVPNSSNPPSAPSNLTVSKTYPDDKQAFYLEWKDNSYNEEYFRISISSGGASTMDVSRNSVAATVSNVSCGQTYTFEVQAVNRSLTSDASNIFSLAADPCIPSAPTGLTATLSGDDIALHWNNNNDVKDGFRIYRRSVVGQYYTIPFLIATVGNTTTTFIDFNTTCYHSYVYFVTAYNITGESIASVSVAANAADCFPPAPSNLDGIPTQTTIPLTWTDNSNLSSNQEDGFRVYSLIPPPINVWSLRTTLPPDSTSYTLTGLNCSGNLVAYKVVAFNSGGTSTSNILQTQTQACTTPAAPTNLEASPVQLASTKLNLTWDDNSNNEWGFKIERSTVPPTTWSEVATVETNETSAAVTGLQCEHAYSFRVFAYNSLTSTASNIDSATTAACDPNEPIHFTATGISQTQINLSWSKGTGPLDPTRYDIIRANSLRKNELWTPLASVDAPTTVFHDTSVTCGKTYYYGVRAVREIPFSYYASTYAGPVSVATVICDPNAPTTLVATPGSQTEIDLSWLAPASGPVVNGYYVERASHGGSDWVRIFTADPETTAYADTGLTCHTRYDYRVQAYNTGGAGPFSSPITLGETIDCAPAAPSGLDVTATTQDSISLAWTINSINETGFSIQRSPTGNSGWEEVGTTGPGIDTYTDSALDCGIPFVYRVLAFNGGGFSTPSIIAITFTLPCTPTLTATPGQQGLVTLNWVDPSQVTSYYHLERSVDGRNFTPLADPTYNWKSWRDLSAPCGVTLYYHISAENRAGSSPFSSPPAVAQTTCKPTTVMTLSASTASIHAIQINWSASAGGQTGFVLERSYNGQDDWTEIGSPGIADSSYLDNDLPPGSAFFYRLRAVNAGGSLTSNMASATTLYAIMLPAVRK